MSSEVMQELRDRLGRVSDLHAALALLEWDQEVYMPTRAAESRGRQMATLSGVAHRMFVDTSLGELIETADPKDADDAKLIDEAKYDYDRARKLPDSFVEEFSEAKSTAYEVWVDARKKKDFSLFQPQLARMVDLLRRRADYLGFDATPYDALLEDYERGMTSAQLDAIFTPLAQAQADLIARIAKSPNQPEFPWLANTWDPDIQWEFTLEVLRDMGYDFEAGRQDHSVHPFTTVFDLYDVRVTTRIDPEDLFSGLTGSTHEGGHALYEQGFRPEDRRTPLAQAPSLGIHESQSRMWENIVGRSAAFWKHYGPKLIERFPDELRGVNPSDLHRAINVVQPSFIRVEADECTYNMHVILRYEIEKALIEGTLDVADVPEVWNAKTKSYLGLEVPDAALGCLQDVHWSHGLMGYFPTYALGNLYASQLFEQIEKDIPQLWDCVGHGDFEALLEWLRDRVHRHGRRMSAIEIVTEATGRPPESKPYLDYLESKYAQLYEL